MREASLGGKTMTQCNGKRQLTRGISKEDDKEGWGVGQTGSSSVHARCCRCIVWESFNVRMGNRVARSLFEKI